jgi:hypothetical protein
LSDETFASIAVTNNRLNMHVVDLKKGGKNGCTALVGIDLEQGSN